MTVHMFMERFQFVYLVENCINCTKMTLECRRRNKITICLLAERRIFRKLFYKSEPDLPTKVALVRSDIQCEEHSFDYSDSLHHSWKKMMTKKQVGAHCAYCQYRI